MPNEIQVGTILVQRSKSFESLEIESEPYSGNWNSLGRAESSGLDGKVRHAGWKLFFMVGEQRALVPAWGGQKTLGRGVKRLLARSLLQHFNCMEVTHINRKHFLGLPYRSIGAHSRHIQAGSQIQSLEGRAQKLA